MVGTLNLLALQFQTLTRLLEASLATSASASSSSSTAEATTTAAASGSTSSSSASTAEQQQSQQTHMQVRQLVADPKFHSLLASYANLLFALGRPVWSTGVLEYWRTITTKSAYALGKHCASRVSERLSVSSRQLQCGLFKLLVKDYFRVSTHLYRTSCFARIRIPVV